MFDKLNFGGAKFEDISEKLSIIGDKPKSHIVVVCGTNNLKFDSCEDIQRKYKELMGTLKGNRYRKVSVMGILTREDGM